MVPMTRCLSRLGKCCLPLRRGFVSRLALAFLCFNQITSGQVSPLSSNGVGTEFDPGAIRIDGSGYFVLRDPVTDLTTVTRFGVFVLDSNGYFVDPLGYRLQGFNDATLTVVGDLQIPDGNASISYSLRPTASSNRIFTD
jgi:hypothetical protein